MDERSINGPARPAGTSPRVWHEMRAEGEDVTLRILTPDFGVIYERECAGGLITVAGALAFRAALASGTQEGRN